MKKIRILFMFLSLVIISCDSGGGSDPAAALEDVQDGIDALSDIMQDYNGDLSSVNLGYALDAFESAVSNDASNLDAQLGLALVRFAAVKKDYIDDLDDEMNLGKSNLENNFSITQYLENYISNIKANINLFSPLSTILNRSDDLANISWADISQSLNQFYNLIDDVIIIELTKVINGLNSIPNDYEFEITGDMQGDSNKESKYIKKGDVDFVSMQAYVNRALFYMSSAYNLDMGSSNDLDDLFGQNSQFLKLRSGNHQHLANAHDDLNDAIDAEEDWITGETGIVTLVDPGQETNEMLAEVDENRELINTIITTDGISIDISGFMNDPPSDLKEILPDYTIITYTNNVCLQWDADSESEWMDDFDFTLGGLLPFGSSDILEYEANAEWEKEICLE